MLDQEKLFFGRKMDPFDYDEKRADKLEEKDRVEIPAYDDKGKDGNSNEIADKEADRVE